MQEITTVASNTLDNAMLDVAGQLSPRSAATYRNDAKNLATWLQDKGLTLSTLTRSDLIEYRAYLGEKYARATAARMLTVTRRLLDEAVKRGELPSNPASDVRGFKTGDNETPHTALNKTQAKELLAILDTNTLMGKRDYALISLLLRTGIRRAEAAALLLGDFSTEQGYHVVTIQHGKGDKRRKAKIPVDVMRVISDYLDATGRKQAGGAAPMFIGFTKNGKVIERAITEKAIEKIVKRTASRINIDLTPHGLRASFVTLALEGGAKLQQVQYAAGHADPRTTERYQKRKFNLDDNATDYVKL